VAPEKVTVSQPTICRCDVDIQSVGFYASVLELRTDMATVVMADRLL